MKLPIEIKQSALDEINKLLKIKGLENNYGLRIAIKGAGCSGINFAIGFDDLQNDDVIFTDFGFKIYIQKKHFIYLTGYYLDFIETDEKKGFVFKEIENLIGI